LVEYINDKKYVYKTCGNYIVVLEKLPDTITNENRFNVSENGDNKLYAKYRANKLLVKKIIHKYHLTNCEKVMSNRCHKIEYKINETVYPDKFDDNLETVCSSGIHYFLNLKPAFYYNLEIRFMNGEYLSWYDSGELFEKCNYIDGKKIGEYLKWHQNGEIYIKHHYINGFRVQERTWKLLLEMDEYKNNLRHIITITDY
jgi:antitoxin component YwqK of YwqJK toxin-antitoxin module